MDGYIERISGEIVDISAPRIHAETSIAMLQRKFGQAADPAGRSLVGAVRRRSARPGTNQWTGRALATGMPLSARTAVRMWTSCGKLNS